MSNDNNNDIKGNFYYTIVKECCVHPYIMYIFKDMEISQMFRRLTETIIKKYAQPYYRTLIMPVS